jgi:DNA helicase-2/ATP-dependent DNA helicase PcrA
MAIPPDVMVNKSRIETPRYQKSIPVVGVDEVPVPSFSRETTDTPYAIGAKALHPKFGTGIIIKRDGSEGDLKLDIFFKKPHGKKRIAVNYVKLIML